MMIMYSFPKHYAACRLLSLMLLMTGLLPGLNQADTGWLQGSANPVSPQQARRVLNQANNPSSLISGEQETHVSSSIQSLVEGLDNDPLLIFEYVHQQIDYVPYFGSMKSATATHLAGRGNDADQASLLIALLRAAGFTANYRTGDVTYAIADLANWLGVDNEGGAVLTMLASNGIPAAQNGPDIEVTRIWVQASINAQILQLDPAFKTYQTHSALDLSSALPYQQANFFSDALSGASLNANSLQNLNISNINNSLNSLSMELVTHIRNQNPEMLTEEVFGQRSILAQTFNALPNGLTRSININNASTFSTMPNNLRHSVRIQVLGMDITLFFHEMSDKRLTLDFQNNNGPSELSLDTQSLATGSALNSLSSTIMTLTIDHPYADLGGTYGDQSGGILVSGNTVHAFVFDFQVASSHRLHYRNKRLQNIGNAGANQALSEALSFQADTWTHQLQQFNRLIDLTAGTRSINHHSFGLIFDNGNEIGIDIPFLFNSLIGQDGSVNNELTQRAFIAQTMLGSSLEHAVFEQMSDPASPLNATSTVDMFNHVQLNAVSVLRSTPAEWTTGPNIRSQLNGYNAADLNLADQLINAGFSLVLPNQGDNTIDSFTGTAIMAIAPGSSIQMVISGGLSGGRVTTPDQTTSMGFTDGYRIGINIGNSFSQIFGNNPEVDDPVEAFSGDMMFAKTDINIGAAPPSGIRFQRQYNSSQASDAGLSENAIASGWSHSYDMFTRVFSSPDFAFGSRQAVELAPLATGLFILLDSLDHPSHDSTDLAPLLIANEIAKWTLDRMTFNSVQVATATQNMLFTKLPDGSFSPPPTLASNLIQIDTEDFHLTHSNGSELMFEDNRLTSWTDRNGNQTLLSYNGNKLSQVSTTRGISLNFTYSNNRLSQVSDHSGRMVQYNTSIDPQSHVLLDQVIDPLGQQFNYAYDDRARLTEVFSAVTPQTAMLVNTYDDQDRVIAQTDGLGNVNTLRYASGYSTLENNPDGSSMRYFYNKKGLVSRILDTRGNAELYNYDGLMRLSQYTDRDGGISQYSYHFPSGELASVIDANGNQTQYQYQEADLSTPPFGIFDNSAIVFADGTSIQYSHDARGNVTGILDQANHLSQITYDATGLPLTITNPSGGITVNTYNPDGTRATTTDDDTGITQYTYDALLRRTITTSPEGGSRTLSYDALDRVTSLTDELGRLTQWQYDAHGKLTQRTDASGAVDQFVYNIMGQQTSHTNRDGDTSTANYDSLHRLTSMTDASNIVTRFEYDDLNRLNRAIQADSSTTLEYSPDGKLLAIVQDSGRRYDFTTDGVDNVLSSSDPLGNIEVYSYDAMDRLLQVEDALNRIDSNSFEARGLLAGVNRNTITSTQYTHDGLGDVIAIQDMSGNNWNMSYTKQGRLATISDPLGRQTSHQYDNLGRHSNTIFADGATLQRSYDLANRLLSRQFSSGLNFTYQYDDLDRLTQCNNLQLGYDDEGRIINTQSAHNGVPGDDFTASYDNAGRLSSLNYAGILTITYQYNPVSGLLASVSDNLTGSQIQFVYDADNRMTDINRSNGLNMQYTYDDADRTSRIIDTGLLDLDYAYDAGDQLIEETINAAPLMSEQFLPQIFSVLELQHDIANQTSSIGFTYDRRGRPLTSPENRYIWDAANRLSSVDATQFEYNCLNQLTSRQLANDTLDFHYNHAIKDKPIVAEQSAAGGQYQRFYIWAPAGYLLYLLEFTPGSGFSAKFPHYDQLGSVLALSNENAQLTDSYAYSPFGELLQHNGNSEQIFTFVGMFGVRYETDSLYQMHHRYYDAKYQRFLSKEPLWPMINVPDALQPYQYAYNNPIKFIDPSGLKGKGGDHNSNGDDDCSSKGQPDDCDSKGRRRRPTDPDEARLYDAVQKSGSQVKQLYREDRKAFSSLSNVLKELAERNKSVSPETNTTGAGYTFPSIITKPPLNNQYGNNPLRGSDVQHFPGNHQGKGKGDHNDDDKSFKGKKGDSHSGKDKKGWSYFNDEDEDLPKPRTPRPNL